ncbi:MAM and LDL-receptor class A domain-containing protein 1-like [Diaphorina citri]|uniref:MAM and LDL-receptor class A domain-containing protein 1-like n=1 Tax=Diaphorina citri TaxID=121845 RepID=A0A3Q0IM76_DIACI|nr:MAM and LDL-receptor class A domain-containing protein 1-like [Diaphorina citri]
MNSAVFKNKIVLEFKISVLDILPTQLPAKHTNFGLYDKSFENPIIVFEGVAKELQDAFRKYRGYVAIDSVNIKNGADCRGHCTFEGGFCRWVNDFEGDDFDWSLGRGSKNPSTGPATDRSSFIYGGMEGGYAFIDSSYPRRPGDIAKLSSEEFDSTGPDSPMCMRFWTHMFGNGIGTLSILLVDSQNNQNERELWSLSGEAGNAWYQAEVTIASPNPFRIVLSAKVGKNNLGDIAVDDISLTPGSCPTAPQIAASNGDCTFEVDECGWSNVVSRERLDDIDWERTSGAALRSAVHDHTLGTEKGYLMTLSRSTVQRPGSRAWFTSRDFKTNAVPRCLSFWFIMNEPFIDAAGPSLGAVSVFTKTMEKDGTITMKPIWRLYNHQGPDWTYAQALISEPNDAIVIEGIWGSSRANGFIAFDDITFFSSSCTGSNCNYWNNRNGTTLKWELGAGTLSNWLGGPNKDASVAEDAEKGGYMFFETSLLSAPVLRVDEILLSGYMFFETSLLSAPVLRVDEIHHVT